MSIKDTTIYQGGPEKALGITVLREAVSLLKEQKKEIGEIASANKKAAEVNKLNSTADLNKFKKAQLEVNAAVKKSADIEKAQFNAKNNLLKLQKQEEQLAQQRLRTKTQLAKESERQAKAAKRQAEEQKKLNNVFIQQKNELNDLRLRYANLAASGRGAGKVARGLLKEITALDAKQKEINKTIGKGAFNQLSENVKRAGTQVRSLASSLGVLGGVQLLRRGIGSLSTVVRDFEQSQADLASISGKTEDQLVALKDQARDLGATTKFTASQVAGLQIELAKLGFEDTEIQDSTQGILNFSAATGTELPRAAKVAGSALRAFNLDASEASRVAAVLGVATTKSALDVGKLETGLSTVAPVANAFGFSIEDTVSLLGKLSDAGFDASSAATSTRNILLNLADANGDLAKQLGRPIKNLDDLSGAFAELDAKGIDLASSLELTDKRSVAAFSTFLKTADSLTDLRDSITDVQPELQEMADKQLDTVNGAVDLLRSAWEGLILDFEDGVGIFTGLKDVILFVARNLETIVKVVLSGVAGWAAYRIQLALLGKEFKKLRLGSVITALGNIGKSLKGVISGAKAASLSFKGLGASIKSIPFVTVISGIATLVTSLISFTAAATDSEKAQSKLNKRIEEFNELSEENSEILGNETKQILARIRAIDKAADGKK